MRAGLVGIFFFAAVLAAGHYYAAPMFCAGALSIPSLDPVHQCTAGALNRQGSMLLYFAAVVAGMFFGILAAMLPGRKPRGEQNADAKPETFEEIIAVRDGQPEAPAPKSVVAAPAAAASTAAVAAAALSAESPAATPAAPASSDANTSAPAGVIPAASAPEPTPIAAAKAESPADAAVSDAVLHAGATAEDDKAANDKTADGKSSDEKPAEAKTAEAKDADDADDERDAQEVSLEDVKAAFESVDKKPEPEAQQMIAPEQAPQTASVEVPAAEAQDAKTLATAEAITAGLAANTGGARRPFEGTIEELVERFRQLRRIDGVNSVAQAQRLLDESTLGALSRGIDPKQHLSDVAHHVLIEDPDLKSSVVRGVVVHIAARLKELGVTQRAPSHSVQ
jgi:hypothetical protein